MNHIQTCTTLDEVRHEINRCDAAIVALLAERGAYVNQAARFKTTTADVEAPKRVEQVIARVRELAVSEGANPDVIEATYRAMIGAFITDEKKAHALLQGHAPV